MDAAVRMQTHESLLPEWPPWKKILFRFFFIYLTLNIAPWTWLDELPGVSFITNYYYSLDSWAVETSNRLLFHIRETLVPTNGSGDTSYGWAQVCLYLSVALVACIVWSLVDRQRRNYNLLDYWLRTFLRYFIGLACLTYGILKIFALQMYFPNLSQLATPLGDFLPMRFSWLFIGYSKQYQIFSGAAETVAGLLLLNRRTVTLGLLIAAGVFSNVAMLNIAYDIPVKIYSIQLFLYSVYLLSYDARRLFTIFVLNRPVGKNHLYDIDLPKRWTRVSRAALKIAFVVLFLVLPLKRNYADFREKQVLTILNPVIPGLYDVKKFVMNGDSLSSCMADSLRWKDVVFDYGGSGSVNCVDTLFNQRYRRGYFIYQPDTIQHIINFKKRKVTGAEFELFNLAYTLHPGGIINLHGIIRKDTLTVQLQRSKRHFQLAERQFHWLSEYNR